MPTEVLLIAGSEGDVRHTGEALRGLERTIHGSLATDGVEGWADGRRVGVHAKAPRPALILLDLNMPRMDGRERLAHIKADSTLGKIPVVFLTASDAEADVEIGYELQEGFAELATSTVDFWLTKVKLPQLTQCVDEETSNPFQQERSHAGRYSARRRQ
jgi:two-component system, chemotaxis family, response regulator Rcp1